MKHCKDCEPAQQNHSFAYISVVLGWIEEPIFNAMEKVFRNAAERLGDAISLPFFNLMTFTRLGRYAHEPDAKDSWRTKCFWLEAKNRGIEMRQFHMGPIREGFVAWYLNKKDGKKSKTIIFNGLPRPGVGDSPSLKWMDNKGIMKKKFRTVDLPVAKGGEALTVKGALKIFHTLEKPVITKPNLGSRSRHTTIHIHTEADLITAFKKAKKLSPLVAIEEELRGSLFRGTLIGGKLVGVIRRDPPQVEGDGVSTLAQLLEKENQRPERQGPIFHTITVDKDSEAELKRQKIKIEEIPAKSQVITFSQKTSRGVGGTTTEMTDLTHPENIRMLEQVASFLNDPLVGVDFILTDITRPWKDQPRSGIIECNSLPFIDLHHYPLHGKPNNVAGKLWDFVLPESKKE